MRSGLRATCPSVDEFGDAALFDPASPYATVDGKRNLLPVQVELDALDQNSLRGLFVDD